MNKKLFQPSFLVIIALMTLMVSCTDSSDCCTNIDVDVQLLYKNGSDENLINSTPDFNESNIKVYYKNGTAFDYAFDANLDHPNMHRIDNYENGDLILTVFPSNLYEGLQSTTLIELNDNTSDTLLCEFELDSNREVLKRAWLNGVELEGRFIEIEK